MNDDSLQLNKRQALDFEVSIKAYKNLYKDLDKDLIQDKLSFDDEEILDFIYSNVLHFYHIDRPDDIENYDLSMEGIITKTVIIDNDVLISGMTPFLCTLKDTGEYVILIPQKFLGYKCVFQNGKKVIVNKSFIEKLNKEAKAFYLCFKPIKLSLKDLLNYVLSIIYPIDVFVYFLSVALVTLLGLFVPLINKYIFSFIEVEPVFENLIMIILTLLMVSSVRIMIDSIKRILQRRVMIRQSTAVNTATMYRILTLRANYFRKNLTGEIAYKLQYINNVCSTILGVVLDTIIVAIFSILYIFQIQKFDKSLVIPSIIIIFASCIVNICCSIVKTNYMKKVMDATSKESGISYDIINGIEKIKITGSERRTFAVWAKEYRKLLKIQYFPPFIVKHIESILKTIELSGVVVFYIICISVTVSKANYIAFLTSFGMLSIAFLNLSSISQIVAEIKTSIDFIKPIIEEVPEERQNKKIVRNLNGHIIFSNVSFSYDVNNKNVIENLNLEINDGEYVAIVGSSGSGKSTIIRLLLGFEKTVCGAIYVDGRDINDYEPSSYRRNIGSVLQNEQLYAMTIKSNIKMSNPTATQNEIEEALKKAEFFDDLKYFPMGLNTFVTENFGLSSGQKQRILLARCFVTNNNIMIFDEATNALDIDTEEKIFENIKNLKCTRIIVAHTFSAMKDCDKIIVLDKGKVAEIGKYDELLKKKNVFYNLVSYKQNDK